EENEDGHDAPSGRQKQCARCPLLALDAPADIEEVARRELEPLDRPLDLRGCRAQSATGNAGLDGDPTASRLAPHRRRPERLFDPGHLAQRHLAAVVRVDEKGTHGGQVAAPVVLEAEDQVEALLSDPDLAELLPDE